MTALLAVVLASGAFLGFTVVLPQFAAAQNAAAPPIPRMLNQYGPTLTYVAGMNYYTFSVSNVAPNDVIQIFGGQIDSRSGQATQSFMLCQGSAYSLGTPISCAAPVNNVNFKTCPSPWWAYDLTTQMQSPEVDVRATGC
jgi:hypothetical protein